MIPFVRLGGDQEMVALLEFMVFKIIFPGGSLGANYVITLRIQALSLVESIGVERSISEGDHIHIFVFTDLKNNRFQKKLIMQNTNI
jgi:hypothetical protein